MQWANLKQVIAQTPRGFPLLPFLRNGKRGNNCKRFGLFGVVLTTAIALTMVSVRAEIRSLPVPAVTIYPGEIISAAMLTEKSFTGTLQSLNAAVAAPETIVGQVAKRTLLAGRVIPLNSVKPPDVIKQGTLTATVFKSGGLTISTTAVALRSGMAGDIIEARNPETGVTVRAIVQSDGTLLIGAP